MRIAIVINTSWNIYNFRKGLVLRLMDEGHQVIAVSPEDEYTQHIITWGCQHESVKLTSTGTNLWQEVSSLRELRRIFIKKKIELVLSFTIKANLYSILACKGLNIPTICNVSGFGAAFLVNDWKSKIAVQLYKWVFPSCDFIFFQNEEDRSDFLKYIPISTEKIEVIPGSGIDLEHFTIQPYIEKSKMSFVMISRLIIEKGIIEFIETAKKLSSPTCEFILIGGYDPSHGRSISSKIFQELQSASYITYFPHTLDIRPFIQNADAVVLPSYREGTPRTLLEGAAMGRPLITTDVPGCRQVGLHGFNAILVNAKNTDSLIKGVSDFIHLTFEQRKILAKNSRIHAEKNYSQEVIFKTYLNRINKLSLDKLGNTFNY